MTILFVHKFGGSRLPVFLEDINPFFGTTDALVLDSGNVCTGFQSLKVNPSLANAIDFPDSALCNTCWPQIRQHCSQTF